MKSWSLWVAILAAGILMGFLTGIVLDKIVWTISYDYVFPPAKYQELGIQIGFLTAAFVGFIGSFRSDETLSHRKFIGNCIACQIGILLITLFVAGSWALLVKWNFIEALPISVTPKARIAFCFGLSYGGLIATLFAMTYFCIYILKPTKTQEAING